jgi:cell division protein FtsX
MFENWAIGSTVNMTNETITKGLNESLNLTNSTVGNSTMSGPFGLVDGASLVGLILIFIVAMTFITMIGNAIKFVSR